MLYSELRAKEQKNYTNRSYDDILFEIVTSMFDWDTDLPSEFVELFLNFGGKCAVFKLDGVLTATRCDFVGNIDSYGIGRDLICTTLNGKQVTFKNWRNSSEVVVIYNNKYRTPDLNIGRFSYLFTECDKSLENNVINSRFTRLIRAKDETERVQIQQAIETNKNGEPVVVTSLDILDDTPEGARTIDLTDVTGINKVQYINQLHTDLLARFYNLYGMATASGNKLAQQSKDEINNGSVASFIIPLDRLNERKKGIEKINELFGVNWSVKFSEAWLLEYTRLTASAEKEQAEIEQIEASIDDVSRETLEINSGEEVSENDLPEN